MKKVILLIISGVICTVFSYGQNQVLLMNGNSYDATSVKVGRTVEAFIDGKSKSIPKADILCVIKNGKKGFTFLRTNNKKIKIAGRDIKNNFKENDIPRLYAYKFFKSKSKSKSEASEIYKMNSNSKLSLEEWESAYYAQKQKLRTRSTIGTTTSVVLGIVAVLAVL